MHDQLPDNANVGLRLSRQASISPETIAIASPTGSYRIRDNRPYQTISMRDLDNRSSSIAAGLQSLGIGPGKRIGLLVRFGEDFIALVFAVLKTGATLVLIDPGMGRGNLIRCLAATNPDGFLAIPMAHAVLRIFRSHFPNAKLNVTVGKRWPGMPDPSLADLERFSPSAFRSPKTKLDDSAAIIFTTGSTGPPKGVLYTHRTFNSQIDQVASHYAIQPGGRDLSCFPLFGLFNAVMGTTTILPDMNPIRPADVDPVRLLNAIDQWQINQSFGSPALWTKVGGYCQTTGRTAPSLRLVLSAGAPVPARVLQQIRSAIHPEGCMHTPYGATEALPIASIESRTILEETSALTYSGAGTCVGHRFSGIRWKVIRITDDPIQTIEQSIPVAEREIGELMVSGDVISKTYMTRTDQNAMHKVDDSGTLWHRMGDVGYLDEQDRFWFCGRKSQRVTTKHLTLHTETIEAVANTHPAIYRSALVGVGPAESQTATLILEPWSRASKRHRLSKQQILQQVRALLDSNQRAKNVERIVIYPRKLPTDIRHNSKIFREKLAEWASQHVQNTSADDQ